MSERGQRVRLGLFVFGALAALATLIVIFGRGGISFSSRPKYYAVFDNAPGIQKGTPVRRSGVNIGEVDTITLQPDGKVRVVLKIDQEFAPLENEVPAISQALLTGDSIIEWIPDPAKPGVALGQPRPPPKPGDDPIQGKSPLDARQAVRRVDPILDVSQKALEEMQRAFREFSKIAPDVQNMMRESATTLQTVREAIPEVRKTNDSVNALAKSAMLALAEAKSTKDQATVTLKNWGDVGEQVNVLLATNREKLNKTVDQMYIAVENANKSMERINKMVEAATKSVDQTNKILTNENIKAFNDTLQNLRSVSDDIKTLPKSADQLMKDASAGVKKFNQAADKVEAAINNAAATLENIRKTTQAFSDRADPILKNVEEGSAQVKLLAAEARQLICHFARSEGTIAKLFNDPSLYNNANDSLLMLARSAPRLERVLNDLEHFSDKIARHPELLGLRGAFKPDSGLKGSPHTPSFAPTTNPWTPQSRW